MTNNNYLTCPNCNSSIYAYTSIYYTRIDHIISIYNCPCWHCKFETEYIRFTVLLGFHKFYRLTNIKEISLAFLKVFSSQPMYKFKSFKKLPKSIQTPELELLIKLNA